MVLLPMKLNAYALRLPGKPIASLSVPIFDVAKISITEKIQ